MSRIRLAPITAVTCNPAFEVIEDAAIHVDGSRIAYVGPSADAPAFEADETIGGDHLVALPGLINTHTHAGMTLLRGYADDMALEAWLETRIWPFERHLDGDDIYWGTLLAICEMLRGGTTCFADMYHFHRRGTDAMIESGIRAAPGATVIGVFPEPARQIEEAFAFVREFSGAADGRITPLLAPHSLYTCDRDHWRAILEGAEILDTQVHTHAAETRREVEQVTATWGAPPIETLHTIGALDRPILAAHCVYLEPREIELAASTTDSNGTTLRVAHNPTSNLKLASGFAPVQAYLQAGITVGVAPDGTASNNTLDLWKEMRLAALLQKATTADPTAVNARQALLMATADGARALNLHEEVGSLEVGKKADIAILDFDKPHLHPCHNVVSHLVYAATAADVDTVLVDGRVLLRHGHLTTLELPHITAEVQQRVRRLVAAAHS
jgi:5-methylthioadenosine/S-adenosylhomocysteine deaminase